MRRIIYTKLIGDVMAFSLSGIGEAVLSALSNIGIELSGNDRKNEDRTPKLIYDISKPKGEKNGRDKDTG